MRFMMIVKASKESEAGFPAEILPPEEAAREQAWRDAQQGKAAS